MQPGPCGATAAIPARATGRDPEPHTPKGWVGLGQGLVGARWGLRIQPSGPRGPVYDGGRRCWRRSCSRRAPLTARPMAADPWHQWPQIFDRITEQLLFQHLFRDHLSPATATAVSVSTTWTTRQPLILEMPATEFLPSWAGLRAVPPPGTRYRRSWRAPRPAFASTSARPRGPPSGGGGFHPVYLPPEGRGMVAKFIFFSAWPSAWPFLRILE